MVPVSVWLGAAEWLLSDCTNYMLAGTGNSRFPCPLTHLQMKDGTIQFGFKVLLIIIVGMATSSGYWESLAVSAVPWVCVLKQPWRRTPDLRCIAPVLAPIRTQVGKPREQGFPPAFSVIAPAGGQRLSSWGPPARPLQEKERGGQDLAAGIVLPPELASPVQGCDEDIGMCGLACHLL